LNGEQFWATFAALYSRRLAIALSMWFQSITCGASIYQADGFTRRRLLICQISVKDYRHRLAIAESICLTDLQLYDGLQNPITELHRTGAAAALQLSLEFGDIFPRTRNLKISLSNHSVTVHPCTRSPHAYNRAGNVEFGNSGNSFAFTQDYYYYLCNEWRGLRPRAAAYES
jgi:hypothetical protein